MKCGKSNGFVRLTDRTLRSSLTFVVQNVMAALFIAELVKLGTQIVLYRRDA